MKGLTRVVRRLFRPMCSPCIRTTELLSSMDSLATRCSTLFGIRRHKYETRPYSPAQMPTAAHENTGLVCLVPPSVVPFPLIGIGSTYTLQPTNRQHSRVLSMSMGGSTERRGVSETARPSDRGVPCTPLSFCAQSSATNQSSPTHTLHHITSYPNAAAAQPQKSALRDMLPDNGSRYMRSIDLDLNDFQSNSFGTNGRCLLMLTTRNNKYSLYLSRV